MTTERWRVAVISGVAPVARMLVPAIVELGHEPVAVLNPRRPVPITGDLAMTDATAPPGVDVLLARGKSSLAPFLRALEPDLTICWGFPWLIPQEALDVPRLGSVNLHPSLLPRHRGPIPLAWAIRSGDPTFGVTWHRMDDAFDTGGILAQAPVPMEPDDSEIVVIAPRLFQVAVRLLPKVFARVAAGDPGEPQDPGADVPYAAWFEDAYAEIDWSQPAVEVHRQVRAWALALGNHGIAGPLATVDGRRVIVQRTSLVEPVGTEQAIRMEAADGPVWIVASEAIEPSGQR
jgi:methionyl-tRNA formyltransferase